MEDEKDFIFFNNLEGGNGSVVHAGDNLTGEGDGDDEQVKISLANVPATVEKIAFTITIHDAETTQSELRTSFEQLCTNRQRCKQ